MLKNIVFFNANLKISYQQFLIFRSFPDRFFDKLRSNQTVIMHLQMCESPQIYKETSMLLCQKQPPEVFHKNRYS